MFEYDLLHWSAFLSAAVLLNLAPGPDMAFILGQTAVGGRRAGFAACLGIWTGAFAHVIMAAAGLSAILATSATAFAVIKYAGVAYLLWLGVQAICSRGDNFVSEINAPPGGLRKVYYQAITIAALNPKVAIFFLAFLPQFVTPEAGPVWAQLALHGTLIIVVGAVVEPPMVLLGAWLTKRVRENQAIGVWIDRSLGALLIGLGLRLAAEQR